MTVKIRSANHLKIEVGQRIWRIVKEIREIGCQPILFGRRDKFSLRFDAARRECLERQCKRKDYPRYAPIQKRSRVKYFL